MLGTIHWMTPTDAVPALCIEMRSPVVVTGFWAMTHQLGKGFHNPLALSL
jgi:hypothetical protein